MNLPLWIADCTLHAALTYSALMCLYYVLRLLIGVRK